MKAKVFNDNIMREVGISVDTLEGEAPLMYPPVMLIF